VTVIATDVLGRTVRASVPIAVANPAPAMTCFVLQAVVEARGTGTVTTRPLHTAVPGERLLALVQSRSDAARVGPVVGGGLAWHRVRRSSGTQGTLELWSALAPRVLTAARVSSRGHGLRTLTLVAMEGTRGPGASTAVGGVGGARSAWLRTTRPTSLVLAVGVVRGADVPVGAHWSTLTRWPGGAHGWTAWVQYTNQPMLEARTEVRIPTPTAPGARWAILAVELPGSGS
jgi:hypothetical protein